MNLLLAGLAALLALHALSMRETLLVREARWKLYAVRDDLRWAAINDPSLRGVRAWTALDETITGLAGAASLLNLWFLLTYAVIFAAAGRLKKSTKFEDLQALVAEADDPRLDESFRRMVAVVLILFVDRHVILTKIVFGIARVFGVRNRLSQAMTAFATRVGAAGFNVAA